MAINRTIYRSFEILRLLKENSKGLTMQELQRLLEMPKTSTFDILQTLLQVQVIERDEDSKRYRLGVKMFELGNGYLTNKSVSTVGIKYLREIAEKLNKTAFIGVLRDDKVVYIQKYEPDITIKTSCVVGSTADLYSTSLGKVLLAFNNEHIREDVYRKIRFVKHQPNTIDNIDDLRNDIEKTQFRGYAIDNNEMENGIFCIGAPIYDDHGNLIAAISVSGLHSPTMDLDYESIELRKTALAISRELGYMGR